jgi:hypothetical protein
VSNGKIDSFEGCKTFFFVPDLSIMPEDFVSTFFSKGFETYYLMDDKHLDIESKVRVILRLYQDVILFFNIERNLPGVDWPDLVRRLIKEHSGKARIGVLCHRRLGEESIAELERKYLYEIGIYCGCIPLEFRKTQNLALLSEVLEANDARGRRSSLRAICGDTSSLNFAHRGASFRGTVRDVSVSHFSCAFEGADPGLEMYEKVANIQLKLGGIICSVNGVVFAKRVVGSATLYVFVFRNSRDRDGLDAEMLAKVNGFIQRHFEQSVRAELARGFGEEIANRKEATAAALARALSGSTKDSRPAILAP